MKFFLLPLLFAAMTLTACEDNDNNSNATQTNPHNNNGTSEQTSVPAQQNTEHNQNDEVTMLAKIDDIAINVQWEDNEAVNALKNLVKTSTITVQMSQYGDFEQVGPLGQSLPHQDEQKTTKLGDIVLYAGNQISIFFAPNTYRYTRLGKITDKTDEELKALLDKDNVTLTLSKDAIHTQTDPTATQKKPLVAYFSVTHHTQAIAEHISNHTGATLYEIVPDTPYTDEDINYGDKNSRTSIEQNDPNARPAIAFDMDNIEQYDPIYLGYPIWWAEAPKIMYTFLENASIKEGTTIVPFCTSGSSGIGSSAILLQQAAPNANWLEGQRFAIGASSSTVANWVDSLNL